MITERIGRRREELLATIFVVCYLGLLLVLSLPPAMIRRVRKGAAIVKSKLRHINRHINHKIHQTLSMPSMPTHGSWQSSLSSLVTTNKTNSNITPKHLQEKPAHSSSLTAMRTVSFSPSSAAGQVTHPLDMIKPASCQSISNHDYTNDSFSVLILTQT